MEQNIVRYGELRPCKTAFIDAHTPGSDQKENFTIIGGGVSESDDHHVHITDYIGINIGVAAPMAFFPFSGWKDSFYGDLHGQSQHAIEFFTQTKVVVERWPKTWSRQF